MEGSPVCQDGLPWHHGLQHMVGEEPTVGLGEMKGNAPRLQFRVFQEGLPQGSILLLILWLCYINDIGNGMPKEVLRSLYTDDSVLLSMGRTIEECCAKLHPYLNRVNKWLSW